MVAMEGGISKCLWSYFILEWVCLSLQPSLPLTLIVRQVFVRDMETMGAGDSDSGRHWNRT